MLNARHRHWRKHPGFGLLDAVLSLFIIGILIVLFASLVNIRAINRRVTFRTQAAAIAAEEISALQRLDMTTLANQANGPFLNIIYNAGSWTVVADASASHSAPNVMRLDGSSGFPGAVSGRMQFPAGSYADAAWQANMNIASDSPAGSAVGFFIRAADKNNGYRLLVAPSGTDLDSTVGGVQNWVLERVVNGAAQTPRLLSATVSGLSTNIWYTVKLVADGTSLKTYLDANEQDSGSIADATYSSGPAMIVGWSGVHAKIDDVTTTVGGNSDTWDFDSSIFLPAAWTRLGLNDLPDNTSATFDDNGLLTIASYPNANSTGLKQATLQIKWLYGNSLINYSTTAILGNSTIGQ